MQPLEIPLTSPGGPGIEILDIASSGIYAGRRVRQHDPAGQIEGLRRIADAFLNDPENLLQELTNIAVTLCGADSAGISVVRENPTDADYFHWVATAGVYTPFLNARLPRYPSACSVCLERGRPQAFRVGQPFFDVLQVDAPLVTDGILLPWRTERSQGTIFVLAHGREEAFDAEDCELMRVLADFAAMGMRHQEQQQAVLVQARATAAAAMANHLAHRINNPLQGLTNLLYLASTGNYGDRAQQLGVESAIELTRLSALVAELLAIPFPQAPKI